ncbi:MAG TPA: hypothetical protein VFY23_09730 [Candidatus Limnocylindrales bacterium]|nr:hypothetical protein [Candidatus Limnocylindrales bacterium]
MTAGYATMARVDGGRVRTLAWAGRVHDGSPHEAVIEELPQGPADAARVEEVGAPIPFGERVGRFRDQLVMVTFFVTDPESWR